jgi:hypothetical protein
MIDQSLLEGAHRAIERWGWREATLILGLIGGGAIVPLSLIFVRRQPGGDRCPIPQLCRLELRREIRFDR